MKKPFLAGVAILLPITITTIVIVFFIDLLTAPFAGLVEDMIASREGQIAEKHHYLLLIVSRLIILILLTISIFLLGILGRYLFFSYLMKLTNWVFKKIPIVKTIYQITSDITKKVFSEKEKGLFKETVLIPFPHENTYALGFLSNHIPKAVCETKDKRIQEKTFKPIFVPTAPHPISGFLLMYSEDDVKAVDIKTEDVFKFLISCGIFHPGEKSDKTES